MPDRVRQPRPCPCDATFDAVSDSDRLLPVLPSVVATAGRRFGERPAFVDPDGAITTFADLHRTSDELAAGMARSGVREGSVVALTLSSDSAYVAAYIATSKLGAVAAGVNPRLTAGERDRCLDVAEPALVIASSDDVAPAGGPRRSR